MLALVALRLAGIELPATVPESLVVIALGALATVFVLIRLIVVPDEFFGWRAAGSASSSASSPRSRSSRRVSSEPAKSSSAPAHRERDDDAERSSGDDVERVVDSDIHARERDGGGKHVEGNREPRKGEGEDRRAGKARRRMPGRKRTAVRNVDERLGLRKPQGRSLTTEEHLQPRRGPVGKRNRDDGEEKHAPPPVQRGENERDRDPDSPSRPAYDSDSNTESSQPARCWTNHR